MSTIRGQGDWEPAEEEKLRAAWVAEPPRLDGPVHLAEYDPRWPALYDREAARIQQYADAKTEVITAILGEDEEDSAR
jgi:GrpB-like predicted nucleotidyltransferase (UPF0157 family)